MSLVKKLKGILPHGIENAKPARELSDELGINERALRDLVKVCRLQGVPIISGHYGYFVCDGSTEDMAEARSFLRTLTTHAKEDHQTAAHVEEALLEQFFDVQL